MRHYQKITIAFTVAVCSLSSLAAARPDFTTLIAHRGESFDAPENTLPAYRTAVERGFGFECDIYLSKDKRLFTFHDADLKRTTAGANSNRCTNVDWPTLEKLNVGGWEKWKGSKFDPTRPALFSEVLSLVKDGRWLYVDVKGADPSVAPYIRKDVEAAKNANAGNVLFLTWEKGVCQALKRELPKYKVLLLAGGSWLPKEEQPKVDKVLAKIREAGADGVDVCYDAKIVTAEFVGAIRKAGFEVHTWTIDDPKAAREALAAGVQTVTTNRAKHILDTLGLEEIRARFADTNVYEVVAFEKGGFDLARTVKRPHTNSALRGTNIVCLTTVPSCEYTRAWVLCDVADDPKKDPFFVLRLQRYVSGPDEGYQGRGYDSVADSFVDLKGRTGRQLVEVPLKMGEIGDIVRTDRRGDWVAYQDAKKRFGVENYLDLELLSRTYTERNGFGDPRFDVDTKYTSGVTIQAVVLEKPSAELEPEWIEPGNIFHNDEKPETRMLVDVKRPADHRLAWTMTDSEGAVVGRGEKKIAASEKVTVDLAQREPGWYGLKWDLFDGERKLLTHTASFAILGRDTRKSGQGEAPYGCGCGLNNAHYSLNPKTQQDVAGKLMLKLGMRKAPGIDTFVKIESPLREKYKLSGPFVAEIWPDQGDRPAEMKKMIDSRLAMSPNSKGVMVLYESSPEPYRQAEEITGGVHVMSNGMRGAEARVSGAKKVCEFLRKNYPDIKITVGNSLVCSELVAELMRGGFPKENADYMGSESVVRSNLPERLTSSSIQGVDCYRELARHYGYPWGVNSCSEHCYRLDTLLGQDYQAWWYVRDLVLMQCWRFPDIYLGYTVDAGNHYCGSFWGNAGFNRRTPYIYPKKSFVGVATATKVLDQVVSRRYVPTGDESVHVVEFARKDGTYAYAVWAVNGAAEIDLETSGKFTLVDFYGRTREARSLSFWNWLPFANESYRITAREQMTYLVGEKPVVVSARVVSRNYENAFMSPQRPKDLKVLATADASLWTLTNGVLAGVESRKHDVPVFRRAGKGVLKPVVDEEKGNVLEVSLADPDLKQPNLVSEYTTIKLKKPIKLKELPASIGVWVKGNAGLGEVYFILEDHCDRYHISSGGGYGQFDYSGLQEINFSGWKLLSFPIHNASSVKEYGGGPGLNWTIGNETNWEYRLVGLVFSAPARPLVLDEHKRIDQTIRLGDVVGFDYGKE